MTFYDFISIGAWNFVYIVIEGGAEKKSLIC